MAVDELLLFAAVLFCFSLRTILCSVTPRAGHVTVTSNGELFLFGGTHPVSAMQRDESFRATAESSGNRSIL